MDFSNQVVLITGAGNGIGRAAALAFAARGASIVAVDRDADGVKETAELVRAAGADALDVVADVTRSSDVQAYVAAAVEKHGRIDCFFNNAGIEGKVGNIADYDEDVFDAVLSVNVKGVFLGLKYVIPVMLKQGGGSIVNTASVAGLVGSPGMSAYVASKHAVIGLTKVAAGEVSGEGVRVNAVCPGPIDTRMVHAIAAQVNPDDPSAIQRSYETAIPLGRYGTADEVANVALFLCSSLSGNVTGAQYVVDGGRTASPKGVTSRSNK